MFCYGAEIEIDAEIPVKAKSSGMIPLVKIYETVNAFETKKYSSVDFFRNNQERDIFFLEPDAVDGRFGILIDSIARFSWDAGVQGQIEYACLQDCTDARLAYWLMQLVLPVYFTYFEIYFFLHASAVEVEGEQVVFFADSFGGKSTMADYFIKKNHALVTDDKLPVKIDDKVQFMSSYPYHRPYRGVEDMGRHVAKLSALLRSRAFGFRLNKVDAESEIVISSVSGAEKFQVIRRASELNFTQDIVKHARSLAAVSNAFNIFDVSVPWNLERLPEVYECIVRYIKEKK